MAGPPRDDSAEGEAPGEFEGIEPGNSALGQPTHGNTPVGKFFAKTHGKAHGRPHGQGGPRRGAAGQAGHGGRPFGQSGRPQHGQPPRHGQPRGGHGPSSPYVMTTLTIPGAVPEGLPGTSGPRPKGPGGGHGPRGPGPGNGPRGPGAGAEARGPGAGQGKKRGRGNRNRRGPKSETMPGNEAPRTVEPAIVDDDIGNR